MVWCRFSNNKRGHFKIIKNYLRGYQWDLGSRQDKTGFTKLSRCLFMRTDGKRDHGRNGEKRYPEGLVERVRSNYRDGGVLEKYKWRSYLFKALLARVETRNGSLFTNGLMKSVEIDEVRSSGRQSHDLAS